mmetsp:Transcript_6524/g.12554  ORF Transcript_6524/g.12554 Transcript_6524/m.12554 type:complete len:115 (+) Transcript_6524:693-1037(+)
MQRCCNSRRRRSASRLNKREGKGNLQQPMREKKRLEQGIKDEEEEQPSQSSKKGRKQQASPAPAYQAGGSSRLMAFAALAFIALVCVGGYIAVKYLDDQGKKGKEKSPKKPKKK